MQKLSTITVEVLQETELFEPVKFYLGGSLKVAGKLAVTLVKRLHCLGQESQETELFKSVELYLGKGLEMAGHLAADMRGETAQSPLRSSRTELSK